MIGAVILLRQLLQPCFCRLLARCGACRCSCLRRERWRLALSYQKASNIWLRFWLVTFFEFMIASAVGLHLKDRVVHPRLTPSDHLALLSAWVYTILIVAFVGLVAYMTTFKGRKLALTRKAWRQAAEKRVLDDWKEQTLRELDDFAESEFAFGWQVRRSGSQWRRGTAAARSSATQRDFMRKKYLGYFLV